MISVKQLFTNILVYIKAVQPYQIKTVSTTVSIAANSGANFNLTIPTISGYTPVGFVRFSQNHGNSVFVTSQDSISKMYLYNSYSSAQSTTLNADVLYIKNKLCGGGGT